jgi:hypothetical protein
MIEGQSRDVQVIAGQESIADDQEVLATPLGFSRRGARGPQWSSRCEGKTRPEQNHNHKALTVDLIDGRGLVPLCTVTQRPFDVSIISV